MIKFEQQPDSVTCVSACISMITGIEIGKVIAEFHVAYSSSPSSVNPYTYMKSLGMPIEQCYTLEDLDDDYVYIVSVPSLNNIGGMHSIVIYWSPDTVASFDDSDTIVLDPNKGRQGAKWYHFDPIKQVEYSSIGGVLVGANIPVVKIKYKDLVTYREGKVV